ncbi:MAG: DUF1566 domain-containing protein [Candidatus Riflebacteria bacterium]|nr:DUF1566 domain-containing protein [Candidatus Riflebacteria bacterium]
MKKYICLFIAIALIGGVVFSTGCNSNSSMLGTLGIIFTVAILASTGGAAAPVAFAASVRESVQAKVYLSSVINRGNVKIKITPMKTDSTVAPATTLDGSSTTVNNTQNQLSGTLHVTVPDSTYTQFKTEVIYSDSQNEAGSTLIQSYFSHDPTTNAPQQVVDPNSTAKAIIYDQWKGTSTDKTLDTFNKNLDAASLSGQIQDLSKKIEDNLGKAADSGQLSKYSPTKDTDVLNSASDLAKVVPTKTTTGTTTSTASSTSTATVAALESSTLSRNTLGIVTDSVNNLQWYYEPFFPSRNWSDTKTWVASLTVDSDRWRMPTVAELQTLYPTGYKSGLIPMPWAWSMDPDFYGTPPATFAFNFSTGNSVSLQNGVTADYGLAVRTAFLLNIKSATVLSSNPDGTKVYQFVAEAIPTGTYKFDWTFDDNTTFSVTSDVATVTHTFAPGAHPILVSLSNALGKVLTSKTITVSIRDDQKLSNSDIDKWRAANSGGFGTTNDNWDISKLPDGVTFDMQFNAYSVPDKFIVVYCGNVVYQTGWRGDSSYNGKPAYPGGVTSPGNGEQDGMFVKIAGQNSFQVTTIGGEQGTAWDYSIRARKP